MGSSRFLFIPHGAHPAHCDLVEPLRPVWFRGFHGYALRKNYVRLLNDVHRLRQQMLVLEPSFILCEAFSVGACLALCRSTHLLPANVTIGAFAADQAPFYVQSKRFGLLRRAYYLAGARNVDFFVCVSEMVANLLRDMRCPERKMIRVVEPMLAERYERMGRVEPSLDSDTILFVGNVTDYYYKGLDLLLDVYERVRGTRPVRLLIVGDISGVPGFLRARVSELRVCAAGRQNDITPYLAQSSLCLHLGRGDTCPLSTQEAMRAGVPTMVSEWTGTREIVEKACPEFVVPLDSREVARRVERYFSRSDVEKRELSRRFRRVMDQYDPRRIIAGFPDALRRVAKGNEDRR